MTPEQRIAAAVEMSEAVMALAEAGLRNRHPDFSDEEIQRALAQLLLGPDDPTHRGRATPL